MPDFGALTEFDERLSSCISFSVEQTFAGDHDDRAIAVDIVLVKFAGMVAWCPPSSWAMASNINPCAR